MEFITELLKITIPAALVLYGMYLAVQSFLRKDYEQKLLESRHKQKEITVPIRLQAYERMVLFLERITPSNLLPRLNDNSYKVAELQQLMLSEIRNEFAHNFSQQLYMSEEAWHLIRSSMERLCSAISDAGANLPPDAPAMELVRKLVEHLIHQNDDFTADALAFLKKEAKTIF
jgi:hypothetical protein